MLKRKIVKLVMMIMQFIFYFVVNELFDVPDRIMYNTFFIYLALNLAKNMYSFKTILIWEELKNAKEVHREEPFYMTIPAKEIYKKDVEEKILVQGIIDLYYIDRNDNLVLLDYKTDYLENGAEELIQKYDSQLQLYKKALEDALNTKVDKIYIYSTYLGKAIKI